MLEVIHLLARSLTSHVLYSIQYISVVQLRAYSHTVQLLTYVLT